MNKLPDDVLLHVLKYGYIEDIMAKERDSVRFGRIVLKVVSKKKRFHTKNLLAPGQQRVILGPKRLLIPGILKIIKKMPSLTDVSNMCFESWTFDQIKELSTFNTGITCFHHLNMGSEKSLFYVTCVREANPKFKADRICLSFDSKKYLECMERFPDLDLKIIDRGRFSNRYKADSIGSLRLWNTVDHISNVLPNVTRVELSSEFLQFSDLRSLFPNLSDVLFRLDIGDMRLAQLYPSLPHTLRKLSISHRLSWSAEDLLSLRSIIDNIRLVNLELWYFNGHGLPTQDVLQLFIDSPMRTLRKIDLNHFKLSKAATSITVNHKIGDIEILDGVLRRFRKVSEVLIESLLPQNRGNERMKEICRQVVATDRRRAILLDFDPPQREGQFRF